MSYLANRVNVIFRPALTASLFARAYIDYDGHVDVPSSHEAEILLDQGVATREQVGPDDWELFLTDKWRKELAPILKTLQGWKDWPSNG